MGLRGDRERDAARRERAAAQREHARAEEHTPTEPTHRRVERQHRAAADAHERAARLFDAHDDPTVSETDATAIANEVIGGRRTERYPF
jgi:hypothetical protein